MTNIITTLLRGINKNRSLINTHIGELGTDVHPDCDYRSSGFMNPTEKTLANNKAIDVADGTDIFALDSGRYRGKLFKNAPSQVDKSTSIVDIRVIDETHKVIDYYWLNGKKTFHAYQGISDSVPDWSTPIIGRNQQLKNNAKGSVTLSAYRYADHVRAKLDVDVNGLNLQPGGYVDAASIEFKKFYPDKTLTGFAVGTKSGGGVNKNIEVQITTGGNIRIVNTDTAVTIGSCEASLEYTIDNAGGLPAFEV